MKTITLIFALCFLLPSFAQVKKKNERLRMELEQHRTRYDSLEVVYETAIQEVNEGIKLEYLGLMTLFPKNQNRIQELRSCIESNQSNLSRLKEPFDSVKEVQLPNYILTSGSKKTLNSIDQEYRMVYKKLIPVDKPKVENEFLEEFIEEYTIAFGVNVKTIQALALCKTELRVFCDTLSVQLKEYTAYVDYLEVENQRLAHRLRELEQKFRSKDSGLFPASYQEVFLRSGESIVKEPAEKEPFTYDQVDQNAEYPGGVHALKKYLFANFHLPEVAVELGISGKAHFKFLILEDGSVSNIKVVRGFVDCQECDQEAIRVIQSMPKWKPAMVGGKPVRVNYSLPIMVHWK